MNSGNYVRSILIHYNSCYGRAPVQIRSDFLHFFYFLHPISIPYVIEDAMNQGNGQNEQDIRDRLSRAYITEKPGLTARLRAAGKSWEETEDLIHDVYAETWGKLDRLTKIVNLPAWLNSLVTRRLIDAWRHEKVRRATGENDIAEETLREVIAGIGLDPLDAYVSDCMIDALNDAMKSLPDPQRKVIEAQVFGGKSFARLARETGENIDTLKARKRYGVRTLSLALRQWIDE